MNGFVVVDVGMCPILVLRQWVVDVQLLGESFDVVLLVVANVDVIANVAHGDVGLDGYVHAIAILKAVDPDVDPFATFDVVDALLVVYFATLLDVVVPLVVVVDVLHPCSPFDVLNPFHPLDVWNPLHPFDAVDVRFGANLLDLAHLDDFDDLVVGFPYDFA